MTAAEIAACPTVPGPSMELTEAERKERDKPKLNGGIYESDFEAIIQQHGNTRDLIIEAARADGKDGVR